MVTGASSCGLGTAAVSCRLMSLVISLRSLMNVCSCNGNAFITCVISLDIILYMYVGKTSAWPLHMHMHTWPWSLTLCVYIYLLQL